VIFVHQNLISNRLTSSACKINRWVNSLWFWQRSLSPKLVSAKHSANRLVQTKNKRLHFIAYLWSQSEFQFIGSKTRQSNI